MVRGFCLLSKYACVSFRCQFLSKHCNFLNLKNDISRLSRCTALEMPSSERLVEAFLAEYLFFDSLIITELCFASVETLKNYCSTVLLFEIVTVFLKILWKLSECFLILFINSVNSVCVCVEIYIRLLLCAMKIPASMDFLWFFFVISRYPKFCI